MAVLVRRSPFLTIPLELRDQIYKEALVNSPHGLELLTCCRQIYVEAQKYLFQRPLVFGRQLDLHSWLEKVPSKNLKHVTEATLEVHDVDLGPILASGGGPVPVDATNPPPFLTFELYEKDLERLLLSLGRLSNIKTLTIIASSDSQSLLYRNFIKKILKRLSSLWPGLQALSLEGNVHHQSLSFLATLSDLRFFSFDGFSSSSWVELAQILSALQRLRTLSLVPRHWRRDQFSYAPYHMNSDFTSGHQSFTSDLLRSMNRLESLSITEYTFPRSPSLFFTPETMTSFVGLKSLKNLTIRMSDRPSTESLLALAAFLKVSPITHLELNWPALCAETLDMFHLCSATLKDLWVRAYISPKAFHILRLLIKLRGAAGMQGLEQLVLIRDRVYDHADRAGRGEGAQHIKINEDTEIIPGSNTTYLSAIGTLSEKLHKDGVKVLYHTENA